MAVWDDILPDIDRQVFEASGMAGKTREMGRKPVILVIDVMYTFCGDYPEPILDSIKKHRASCGAVAWDGIAEIGRLLDAGRERHVPIVYTVMEQRADGFDRNRLDRANARADTPTDYIGSYANAVVEEIAPAPEDLIINKPQPSAFFGTPLINYLTHLRADSVIVTGCVTSGCVRAAAVDARQYGFDVMIPEGCVWDRGELAHKASLFDLHMKAGDVVSTDAAIDYVLGLEDRPFGDRTPTKRLPEPSQLPTRDHAPAPAAA